MSHTIPTTNNTGMTIKITSLIISLYKRIAINVCLVILFSVVIPSHKRKRGVNPFFKAKLLTTALKVDQLTI